MGLFTGHAFPKTALIRQEISSQPMDDLEDRLMPGLQAASSGRLRPGQTVALAVGSRKIHAIDRAAALCVRFFKEQGVQPVLVPAMGSHGGATPEGQTRVLESLGILAACPGVPVWAGMEVRELGRTPGGSPVYFSARALEADHVAVLNRVKPHTKFDAPIQSGLCKMLCVGLGKHEGAAAMHRAGVREGFSVIEDAARLILDKADVLAGAALVEDGCGQLSRVEVVERARIVEREKALLRVAESMMAAIPFDNLDVLVVDLMGKDISGIGMDSNVTGRHRDLCGDFFKPPRPKRIFVRDLSPGSGGNANGVGLADMVSTRLVRAMDLEKTYVNSITAISPEKAAIPMHFDSDRQCLEACLATVGLEDPAQARLVRIISTADLRFMQVSRALEAEVDAAPGLGRLTEYSDLFFDANGNLGGLDETG